MVKIVIVGVGGVGGYFGGMLAMRYENSPMLEIYFIARGENQDAIAKKGLQLETTRGNFICRPKLVTDDINRIGEADYIIYCTKSYGLEQSLAEIKPCVAAHTVILPLLNGVDSYDRIKAAYPANEVWKGCVYIVARLAKPGVVIETGNVASLFFGLESGTPTKLTEFKNLLKKAGIDATHSADIEQTVWEKFVFISPLASLTSYLDKTSGQIIKSPKNKKLLAALIAEIKALADAKGIQLSPGIVQKTMDKITGLPPQTTSSMHSDFKNGKQTELESLTGYVLTEGKRLNIAMPGYTEVYQDLKMRFEHYSMRKITLSDAGALFSLYNSNRHRLSGIAAALKTVEETKNHLDTIAKKQIQFALLDNRTKKIIGVVAFHNIDYTVPKAEVGYCIDEAYEGKGLTTHAVTKMIDYAFTDLKFNKLFLRTGLANKASRRVAEKCGFEVEGVLRHDYKIKTGQLIDSVYYGLLNTNQK